jgi:hypothetical protein
MKRTLFCALVLAAAQPLVALAQLDEVEIDLTGVQFADGVSQYRSSAPDALNPSYAYAYDVHGLAKGDSGLLGALFPTPTDIGVILDTIAPGSSDLLTGEAYNPSGMHPYEVINETVGGTGDLGGITVTVEATIAAGTDADGIAQFSLTDVVLSPSFLVGSMTITEGAVTITKIPAITGDANWDGAVNSLDIEPFILALQDPDLYVTIYGHDARYANDANRDGALNTLDIEPFIDALLGP